MPVSQELVPADDKSNSSQVQLQNLLREQLQKLELRYQGRLDRIKKVCLCINIYSPQMKFEVGNLKVTICLVGQHQKDFGGTYIYSVSRIALNLGTHDQHSGSMLTSSVFLMARVA